MKSLQILVCAVAVGMVGANSQGVEPDFGAYWRDGKAELNGYRLTVSRYGQPRNGQAVLIYVTEPFSESKRVKVDDWTKHPRDTFDVLKLNLVRDFQTGIYDYNTMVSVFSRSENFEPVKISFSSAEWCGHVYEEVRFNPLSIRSDYFSYFEDESGTRRVQPRRNGIAEDNLFILLRGLRQDFLAAGEKRSVALLPSLYHGRLGHKPLAWTTAEIARGTEPQTIQTPAGKFSTVVYSIKIDDGREGKFFVEQAYPHRIVRWELLPDIAAELTGTIREEYWRLHDNGHESYLKQLDLKPTTQ